MSRNNEPLDILYREKRFNGIPKWLKSPTEVQVEDEMYKVNEVWKNINTRRIEKEAEDFANEKGQAEKKKKWQNFLNRAKQQVSKREKKYHEVFDILEVCSKNASQIREDIEALTALKEGLENSKKTFSVRRMIFNLIRRLLGKMTTEERLKELSSDIDQKITAMKRVRNYFDGYTAYLRKVKPLFFLISSHNEDPSISEGKKKGMNKLFDKVFSKTTGRVNENELNEMLKCKENTKEKVNSMKKEWEKVLFCEALPEGIVHGVNDVNEAFMEDMYEYDKKLKDKMASIEEKWEKALKKPETQEQANTRKRKKKKRTAAKNKEYNPEKQLEKNAKAFIKTLQGEDLQVQIQTELAQLKKDYALLEKRHEKVLVSGRTVRALAAWIAFRLQYTNITLASEKDAETRTELLREGMKLEQRQKELKEQKKETRKELEDLLKAERYITYRKKLLKKAETIVQRKKNTKSLGKRFASAVAKGGTVASRFHVSCCEAPQRDTNPNSLTKDGASEESLPTTSLSTPSGKAPKRESKRKGFDRFIPRRKKNKARKNTLLGSKCYV